MLLYNYAMCINATIYAMCIIYIIRGLHCHYDDMIMYVKFYQHHLTAVKSQTSHVHEQNR